MRKFVVLFAVFGALTMGSALSAGEVQPIEPVLPCEKAGACERKIGPVKKIVRAPVKRSVGVAKKAVKAPRAVARRTRCTVRGVTKRAVKARAVVRGARRGVRGLACREKCRPRLLRRCG